MSKFVAWWIGQLAGMFAIAPAREHSDAIILDVGRDTVSLLFRTRGTTTREAQVSAGDAGIRQIAERIAMGSGMPRPLLLRLEPAQVLHKQLSLPIAARHDLKQALGFEIDRETPFARGEVYWNYRAGRQASSRNRIDVDLAVVPRSVVDPIVDSARRAGLDPSGIEVDMGADAAALIPLDAENRAPLAGSRRSLTPLAVAAFLLLVIALAIPFVRQQRALASADAMIASLNQPAREALALRQRADRLAGIVASLKKERQRNDAALAALAAASKSLPDDTYLTAFRLRAGRLTMSGLSPSAAKLVGLLARTPAFREPTLDSPVVASGSAGLEAFSISVNVTPGRAS